MWPVGSKYKINPVKSASTNTRDLAKHSLRTLWIKMTNAMHLMNGGGMHYDNLIWDYLFIE
ncbi:MAG: hypothetical protein ACKESC_01905 [Candidatus Hodgkinia cicadicola]